MSLMDLFIKRRKVPKLVAGIVDAVVDRFNDKYAIDIDIKARVKIVDVKPELPKVDLHKEVDD